MRWLALFAGVLAVLGGLIIPLDASGDVVKAPEKPSQEQIEKDAQAELALMCRRVKGQKFRVQWEGDQVTCKTYCEAELVWVENQRGLYMWQQVGFYRFTGRSCVY